MTAAATPGAIVLCGGRSTRMGRDKAALPFHGDTLLGRAARLARRFASDVVVVARPAQELPPLPDGVRVVRDEVPDQGPLGGLAPGLRASRADVCFASSCDTPHLQPAVARLLFERIGGAEAAFAEVGGRVEPLCAVYRTGVAARIQALLDAGRLRAASLADELVSVRVGDVDLRAADPDLSSLTNCNTPEAYAAAFASPLPLVRAELLDETPHGVRASVEVRAATLGAAVAAAAAGWPELASAVAADGTLSPRWGASLGGELAVEDPLTPLVRGDVIRLRCAPGRG